MVEDFLVDAANGVYAISNPGEGLGKTIFFYDYSAVPGSKATRTYTGVELNLRKRYSNNWQLYASYLWSKLEGNYDGVFQASTGQLDPNINSAFDYADFFINADGKLSNDREHTVKINGSYTFEESWAKGLTLGLSTYWRTGTPLTAYGYSFGYSNWEYYLTPRGSLGRNSSDYEADVHIGYPIEIGDMELQLLVDVFNVLDRQSTINLDQRYNLDNQPFCAGIPDGLCGAGGCSRARRRHARSRRPARRRARDGHQPRFPATGHPVHRAPERPLRPAPPVLIPIPRAGRAVGAPPHPRGPRCGGALSLSPIGLDRNAGPPTRVGRAPTSRTFDGVSAPL